MKINKRTATSVLIGMLCLICVVLLIIYEKQLKTSVNDINEHLSVDQIKLGMSEDEVTHLWGMGQQQEGFGGHFRQYADKKVTLGFAGDQDNDLYDAVSTIDISNPSYKVFDISIGDSISEASVKLRSYGFKFDGELYVKDEFTVALRGESNVNQIQIWFNDDDLKDRQY